jgi:hypothetical protein
MDTIRESSALGSFILPMVPGIGTGFDFPSAIVAIPSTPDVLFWTTSDRGLRGRAGKDYWILYESRLVIVKLIAHDSRDEKSMLLKEICDCIIDGNTLEVRTQVISELGGLEKSVLGSEKSAGLIQHKWFAQAIVNQITLSKSITQDPHLLTAASTRTHEDSNSSGRSEHPNDGSVCDVERPEWLS